MGVTNKWDTSLDREGGEAEDEMEEERKEPIIQLQSQQSHKQGTAKNRHDEK